MKLRDFNIVRYDANMATGLTDGRDVVMVTLKKEKSKRYKALGEVGHFTNKKEEGTNK